MKERPIPLYDWEVRAILENRKSQTRRVIKGQPFSDKIIRFRDKGLWRLIDGERQIVCPYGKPGDRLWVRETWGTGSRPDPFEGCVEGIEYKADDFCLDENEYLPLYTKNIPDDVCLDEIKSGWRPSIHIPRWASRITLEITGVRVERVQDISEADARAEGVSNEYLGIADDNWLKPNFENLWDSINEKRGFGWDQNPWVWVVEFKQSDAQVNL